MRRILIFLGLKVVEVLGFMAGMAVLVGIMLGLSSGIGWIANYFFPGLMVQLDCSCIMELGTLLLVMGMVAVILIIGGLCLIIANWEKAGELEEKWRK